MLTPMWASTDYQDLITQYCHNHLYLIGLDYSDQCPIALNLLFREYTHQKFDFSAYFYIIS